MEVRQIINLSEAQQKKLIDEVFESRQEYVTDGYSMSIGEIISMYKDHELDINPDFQRNYRWTLRFRSRLIESILIGVPLPSIFVYQTEKGIWEVVDGVQRLSTILEFMGELRDENGDKLPALVLEKTKMIPALEGISYSTLPREPLQIDFRRTKVEVKIIKSTSHKNAKFEIFQRLNQSSVLSGQEFRNAVLIMIDKSIYSWLKELAEYQSFISCIDLTEKWKEQKYNYELVVRLFTFSLYANKPIYTIDDFLDENLIYDDENSIISLIKQKKFDLKEEGDKFMKTFDLLFAAKGSDSFKKIGRGNQFLESYFEVIAVGLYYNIDQYSLDDTKSVADKIEAIDPQIPKALNTSTRIPKTVELGKSIFKK